MVTSDPLTWIQYLTGTYSTNVNGAAGESCEKTLFSCFVQQTYVASVQKRSFRLSPLQTSQIHDAISNATDGREGQYLSTLVERRPI